MKQKISIDRIEKFDNPLDSGPEIFISPAGAAKSLLEHTL